jgi:hypothetical protein
VELDGITQETLAMVQKAQTAGWTSGTGGVGIDLSGIVSLVPVFTPTRDALSRVRAPEGNKVTQWRALLNITNQQPSIFTGYDTTGSLVQTLEQDVYSGYVPIAMDGQVTQDSIDIAKGYADPMALQTLMVLNMLKVKEDQALATGGQAFALPTIGTVVLSTGAPTSGLGFAGGNTGGSLPSGQAVYVRCQPRSGFNYFNGGSGPASTIVNATTASSTSNSTSVGAFVPAVKGAVAYDWFVGPNNTGSGYYYTTTTTNTVLITSMPTTNQALPTYELPLLFGTVPAVPTTTDTSFSTLSFNSILATILGDYGSNAIVTSGTGTSSGAYFLSADGAKITVSGSSVPLLDQLNLAIFNSVQLSPDVYMMSAQQASDLSSGLLGTGLAPTFLDASGGRQNVQGSGYVSQYLNKAFNGKAVRIEVHPGVPPGTIIARTDSVPFPASNIGNVFEVRTLRDFAQFNYGVTRSPSSGPSGPREEFTIRSLETVVNRAPVSCGVISNIGASE